MKREKIYRVRMYFSRGNNTPHYYYHADVIAYNKREVLKALREGRVINWRWIDSFDRSDEPYTFYEIMYKLDINDWYDRQTAARPKKENGKRLYRLSHIPENGFCSRDFYVARVM